MFDVILLCFGIFLFLISWYNPIPYGRFSDSLSLMVEIVPNRWFIALANLPALVCLCFQTDKLSGVSEIEEETLEFVDNKIDGLSRLSCQIEITEELDGMSFQVPTD